MRFEATKREIIASVSILAIMLIIGILVSGKVSDYCQDQNAKYNKAFKIDKDSELFTYAMKTNVGNAFVEGQMAAIDTVSHEDIKGKYLSIERVKEKYTMHTRTVTTRVNGKSRTRTETYWTWDRVGSETFKSKKLKFLGVTFDTSKFDLPGTKYIDTVKGGYHIRYKYYGLEPKFNCTIFTNLRENTISGDKVEIYKDKTITETLDDLTNDMLIYLFWVIWILLIGGVIYLFIYLENDWLNK